MVKGLEPMPTLECLDERTQRVLDKLEEMYELFTTNHRQLKDMYLRREASVDEKFSEIENKIHALELVIAKEDGRKSITMWLGGAVIAMGGALANTFLIWFLGPNGPLNKH